MRLHPQSSLIRTKVAQQISCLHDYFYNMVASTVGMLKITYRVSLFDATDVICTASVEAKSCAATLRLDNNDVSSQSNIHDDVGSALAQRHGDFIAIGRPVAMPATPLYANQVGWMAGPLFEANVGDIPLAQVGLVELLRNHKSNA
jgi:hypothetical protein